MLKKLHIIFVMPFSPKYGYLDGPPPIHTWKNDKGEELGIWKEDWAHLLGFRLMSKYPDVTFEALRPDYRAERVYEHIFKNGFIHKSFPQDSVNIWRGIKRVKDIYSFAMEKYLTEKINNQTKDLSYLLMLPATRMPFSLRFTEKCWQKIPMLHYHLLSNRLLAGHVEPTFNPFRLIHRIFLSRQTKYFNNRISTLVVEGTECWDDIKNIFTNLYLASFGFDLEDWKRGAPKEVVKRKLGLDPDIPLILFSNRLVPEYQALEAIEVFSKFPNRKFKVIFTSTGDAEYIDRMKGKIEKHSMLGKISLEGYVGIEKLKLLVSASDLFCNLPTLSGGSFVAKYAMLLGAPIMVTDTCGETANLLKKYACGLLVDPFDYRSWERSFRDFFDGKIVKAIDPSLVQLELGWDENLKRWRRAIDSAVQER